jgi:hypothetical protein
MRSLTLNHDIVMSGGAYSDGWYFSKIQGWFGFDDVNQETDDIEGGDGQFYEDQTYLPSAVISVTGVYVGASKEDAHEARNRLAGLRRRGRKIDATFNDEVMPTSREVFVRRAVPDNNRHSSFDFTIDMVAHDPYRYGEEVVLRTGIAINGGGLGLEYPIEYPLDFGIPTTQGRISLSNFGSEPTSPSFRVSGGRMDGGVRLRRQEDGTSIIFRHTLAEDDVLELSPSLETATVNGIDASVYLTVERWPEVEPGDRATIQFQPLGATKGSPTLTGKIRPAYL